MMDTATLPPARDAASTDHQILVLVPTGRTADVAPIVLTAGRRQFGSSPECDVRIDWPGVEQQHCLVLTGSNMTIVRAWSAKTWVNDAPVQETKLRPGDRLSVGPVVFRVRRATAEEAEAIPAADIEHEAPRVPDDAERRVRERLHLEQRRTERELDQQRTRLQEPLQFEERPAANHRAKEPSTERLRHRAMRILQDAERKQEHVDRLVAELEQQAVDELRRVEEQTAIFRARQDELSRRENDLAVESAMLRNQSQTLQQRQGQLELKAADAAQTADRLYRWEQSLQRHKDRLKALQEDLDARSGEIESAKTELEEERQQLAQRGADLRQQREVTEQQHAEREQNLRAGEWQVQQREEKVTARESAITDRMAKLDARAQEIAEWGEETRQSIADRAREIDLREQELQRQQAELQQQAAHFVEQNDALLLRQRELQTQQAELDRRQDEVSQARQTLAEQERQLAEKSASVAEQVRRSDREREELNAALAAHQADVKNWERQRDEELAEISSHRTALDERAAELRSQEQQTQDETQQQRASLKEERRQLANHRSDLQRQSKELEERIRQADAENARREQVLQAAEDDLREKQTLLDEQAAAMESQLHERQQVVADEGASHAATSGEREVELDELAELLKERESTLEQRARELEDGRERLRVEEQRAFEDRQRLEEERLNTQRQQQQLSEQAAQLEQERTRWEAERQQAAPLPVSPPMMTDVDDLSMPSSVPAASEMVAREDTEPASEPAPDIDTEDTNESVSLSATGPSEVLGTSTTDSADPEDDTELQPDGDWASDDEWETSDESFAAYEADDDWDSNTASELETGWDNEPSQELSADWDDEQSDWTPTPEEETTAATEVDGSNSDSEHDTDASTARFPADAGVSTPDEQSFEPAENAFSGLTDWSTLPASDAAPAPTDSESTAPTMAESQITENQNTEDEPKSAEEVDSLRSQLSELFGVNYSAGTDDDQSQSTAGVTPNDIGLGRQAESPNPSAETPVEDAGQIGQTFLSQPVPDEATEEQTEEQTDEQTEKHVEESAAVEPPTESAGESDDPIADYMAQLLERSRTAAETRSSDRQKNVEIEAVPVEKQPVDHVEQVEKTVPEPLTSLPTPKTVPDKNDVRQKMANFRELANLSARSAVAKHTSRKLKSGLLYKGLAATIGVIVTVALLVGGQWNGNTPSVSAIIAGVATLAMLVELARSMAFLSQLEKVGMQHLSEDLIESELEEEDRVTAERVAASFNRRSAE